MVWAKARKFSGASAAIFAFTALSATTALIGSTAPKALLYKDCAVTALIGLIFVASCVVARKPVVFYMAQRWGTDGTHDGWRPSTRCGTSPGTFAPASTSSATYGRRCFSRRPLEPR